MYEMYFPSLAQGDQFDLSNTLKKDNLNNANNPNIGKLLNTLIFYYQFCGYKFFKGLFEVYTVIANYCVNYMDEDNMDEIIESISNVKVDICTIIAQLLKEEDRLKNTSKAKHQNIIFAIKSLIYPNKDSAYLKQLLDPTQCVGPNQLLDFLKDRQKDEEGSEMYFNLEEEEYNNFQVN